MDSLKGSCLGVPNIKPPWSPHNSAQLQPPIITFSSNMEVTSNQKPIQVGLPPLGSLWPSLGQPQKIASSFFSESHDTSVYLRPVSISPTTYQASLNLQVPLTFVIGYVTTVMFLNRLNASRKFKPWAFTKTTPFRALVVLHNASLAVFSAWVLYGMCYSMQTSWPAGATKDGPDYYAHIAQMFCETDSRAIRGKMRILRNIC